MNKSEFLLSLLLTFIMLMFMGSCWLIWNNLLRTLFTKLFKRKDIAKAKEILNDVFDRFPKDEETRNIMMVKELAYIHKIKNPEVIRIAMEEVKNGRKEIFEDRGRDSTRDSKSGSGQDSRASVSSSEQRIVPPRAPKNTGGRPKYFS